MIGRAIAQAIHTVLKMETMIFSNLMFGPTSLDKEVESWLRVS